MSWNATAELFVNLVDNPRLDKSHFVPVAMLTSLDGLAVLAQCYSYGRMADECNPPNPSKCPGPDEVTLYARGNCALFTETSISLCNAFAPGNAYLDSLFPRMDYIISVDFYYATTPAAAQDGQYAPSFLEIVPIFACNTCVTYRNQATAAQFSKTVALFVIALVWVVNACCITGAAKICRLHLISVLLWCALLGPLAWIVLCLRLRHLPLGRVAQLPSPMRQVSLAFLVVGFALTLHCSAWILCTVFRQKALRL